MKVNGHGCHGHRFTCQTNSHNSGQSLRGISKIIEVALIELTVYKQIHTNNSFFQRRIHTFNNYYICFSFKHQGFLVLSIYPALLYCVIVIDASHHEFVLKGLLYWFFNFFPILCIQNILIALQLQNLEQY